MRRQILEALRTGGSILVVLVVILLISTDAKTVIALSTFCVIGYALVRLYRNSELVRPVRTHLTPMRKQAIGVVVVLGAIVAVADEVDVGLWMIGMAISGYTGYRSGRVFRGAISGAVVGVVGAILFVALVGALFLVITGFDVGGSQELLFQVLYAPHVVGFLTLIWVGFALALAGGTGLICGGLGGAVARLL